MTIKASTMNFVRQKAQEGADFAALHEHLKAIERIDVEGEKKKLAKVVAERVKAEAALKDAQQAVIRNGSVADSVVADAKRLRAEAEATVGRAGERASQLIAEAKLRVAKEADDWEKALNDKREQMADVIDKIRGVDASLESKRREHAELEKSHADLIRRHEQLRAGLAALTKDI